MTEIFPWFAARLLFEAWVEGDENPSLFEERIVLVHAEAGVEIAARKAEKLGKAAIEEYANEDGETVSWRFKELLDLVQVNEANIGEGTEVYHQYLNADELEQVRRALKPAAL